MTLTGLNGLEGLARQSHEDSSVVARGMRSLLDKSGEGAGFGVISEMKGFLRLYRDPVIAANTGDLGLPHRRSGQSSPAAFAIYRGHARRSGPYEATNPAGAGPDPESSDGAT